MTVARGEKSEKGDQGAQGAAREIPKALLWRLRRQQLVTFLMVVLFCMLTSFWLSAQTAGLKKAQRASYGECLALRSVVQQTVRNVNASTALTPTQKQQALTTYTDLASHLDCEGMKP